MFLRFYRKRVKIFDNNFNYCLHRIPHGKKENDLRIFDNIAAPCCKTFVVFKLDSFLTSMGPKLTSLGPMSLELHVTSLRPPMISLILPAPVTYLRTQVTFLRPKVTPPEASIDLCEAPSGFSEAQGALVVITFREQIISKTIGQ